MFGKTKKRDAARGAFLLNFGENSIYYAGNQVVAMNIMW